jgi:hypothetical protein
MAYETGANTFAALKLNAAAVAWGTAGAVGTGDRCAAKFTHTTSGQRLDSSPIGTGNQMAVDSQLGAVQYALSLSGEATYQSGLDRIMAQFFGTSGAPTEVTATQGDYRHRMTMNSTWNTNYCTYAIESASATVMEFPSVAFNNLNIAVSQPKSFVTFTADGIANDLILTGTENSNAEIAAATIADTEKMIVGAEDSFWINSDAGALDSGDLVAITDYTINLSKPQASPNEIKGATGNSAPVGEDLVVGTVTVTIRGNTDNAWHTAWKAGTEYKSSFKVEGTQIGAGTNKSLTIFAPRMKLITVPDYNVTENGVNPLTLTFELLAASASPTGMNSALPYVDLVNGRSTAYIS